MHDILLYGLLPASALVLVIHLLARWRFAAIAAQMHGHIELEPMLPELRGQLRWRGISGFGFGLLFPIIGLLGMLVYPQDAPLVAFACWAVPAMFGIKVGSWIGVLRRAVRNRLVPLQGPFIAYLRDRQEERREEAFEGPDGDVRIRFVQRGAEKLEAALPRVAIYGYWDPLDGREDVPFRPLIGADWNWQDNVAELCDRATAIVLDLANCSSGVLWEVEHLGDDPVLLAKTLVLRAENDSALSPEIEAVVRRARWQVRFRQRGKEGYADKLILPPDFLAALQ